MSLGMNRTWILAALVPLVIYAGTSAGQNATLPGREQLAKGIAALRAGDLDSAEKVFTLALHQGVRSPLVYHNLGVIAQERGNTSRPLQDSVRPCNCSQSLARHTCCWASVGWRSARMQNPPVS